MTDQDWPYPDLKLRTPNCPYCGTPAQMLIGGNIVPMAWCTNQDCDAITWDPTVPAVQLIKGARRMTVDPKPVHDEPPWQDKLHDDDE